MGSFSCRSLNRDNRICSRRNSFKNIDSVSETALVDSLPYRNLVRVLSKSVVSRRQAVLFQDATLCPSYQENFFFFFFLAIADPEGNPPHKTGTRSQFRISKPFGSRNMFEKTSTLRNSRLFVNSVFLVFLVGLGLLSQRTVAWCGNFRVGPRCRHIPWK